MKQALLAMCALCLLAACNPYAAMYPTQGVTPTGTPTTTQPPATETMTTLPSRILCTVETGYPAGALNLRTGPGTQYTIIRVLQEGETLTVIERGAWLEVIDRQNARGYINSRFCKIGE